MSVSIPDLAAPIPAAITAAPSLHRLPVAVTLGCGLALALTGAKGLAVWRTGIFLDPDDAMRAVEVRDFLAGQGWFDLVPHRLSPGHPFLMHWSRLFDVPLAASIWLLGLAMSGETAERVTRLLEPALFFVLFLVALGRMARDLVGRWGALAACLLAAGSLESVSDFIPGHIHHHAAQLLLLVMVTKALLDGLDPNRPRTLAVAGALAALSLGINLQNMPFFAVSALLLVLLWVRRGGEFGPGLRWFACGLMGATAAVFLLQVPPSRYGSGTCDTFGAPHLAAAWAGGLALLGLTLGVPRLRTAPARLAAGLLAGGAVLVVMRLTFPACLGDPYGGVDPLLRERWLDEVSEAMPLGVLIGRDPAGYLPIALAIALGTAGVFAAALRSGGIARTRWMFVAVLAFVAVLGAMWQVRVAATAEAFAALGGAWVLCRWFEGDRRPRRLPALLCVLGGMAFTQAGWGTVLPAYLLRPKDESAQASRPPPVDPEACFAPSSYDLLRRLPTGLVLSTIDPGAHVLAYTSHSVLAAPYHRNTDGNRLSLLAFAARPAEAEGLIAGSGARYLALCLSSPEVAAFAARNPDGLAARIAAGQPPSWLVPAGPDAGPMRVFEIAEGLS